jgi:alkylation response protein AidB-like acyl-CoA dehydrogenase
VSGGLLAVARSLEPLIRRHAPALESGRRMPDELVDALYDTGVFRAFLPRELGGLEVDLLEWMDMIEELSRINGSVGWNSFINAGQTALPAETMREILARERWITAGSIGRAAGRARRTDGGYRITGRWPFTSGAPFATYLYAAALRYDDRDEPVVDPQTGAPVLVMAVFPASRATIHDTWDGLGLRGTSSVDVEVDDLFVPDRHVADRLLVGPYDGPLFRGPYFLLMGHCAHALGIGRCAIDAFVDLVRRTQGRPAPGSRRQARLGQQQAHQIAVAKAESLVRSARLFAWDAAARGWEQAVGGRPVDLHLRVLMAQAMIHSARAAREAVELVFERAGSSGVHRGQELERCYRDIATAAQHTLVVETSYDTIGQYYLTKDEPGGPTIERGFTVIMPPP